nr:hypothetical protein [candidate division Zixibacteria bacterium]
MRIFTLFIVMISILMAMGCSKKMVVIKTQPSGEEHAAYSHPSKSSLEASDEALREAKQLYYRDKYKQAQKQCEKAIEFNHRNWEAHYYLGLAMQKRKSYELSIEALGVGLKYSPDNKLVKSEIHLAIGNSWEKLGELGNADKEYELALEFNPDNQYARDAKNRLKVQKTMKNWGKDVERDYDG